MDIAHQALLVIVAAAAFLLAGVAATREPSVRAVAARVVAAARLARDSAAARFDRREVGCGTCGQDEACEHTLGLSAAERRELHATFEAIAAEERQAAHQRAFTYLIGLSERGVGVVNVRPGRPGAEPDLYEFSDGATLSMSPGGAAGTTQVFHAVRAGRRVHLHSIAGQAERYDFTFSYGPGASEHARLRVTDVVVL